MHQVRLRRCFCFVTRRQEAYRSPQERHSITIYVSLSDFSFLHFPLLNEAVRQSLQISEFKNFQKESLLFQL